MTGSSQPDSGNDGDGGDTGGNTGDTEPDDGNDGGNSGTSPVSTIEAGPVTYSADPESTDEPTTTKASKSRKRKSN